MKITVVGLGYVGLPLLLALDRHFDVLGYDISAPRVDALRAGVDHTDEITAGALREFTGRMSSVTDDLAGTDIFIVTVPTPINVGNTPDLRPLIGATEIVGRYLSAGGIVVYESTVYPGCTEEVCVPILEKASSLKLNSGFAVAYSPERISPGKDGKKLTEIVKVVSASSDNAKETVAEMYKKIISAGVFLAPTIKSAEASKVFENTQRDVNIALMNEFAMILDRLGIHWTDVLPSAYTKWNFNRYHPGLVGGHCIGVDPYYLAHKAHELGLVPNVILAGRCINEEYPRQLARKYIKHKIAANSVASMTVIAGVTFKPNCDDIRNSKVEVFAKELADFSDSFILFDTTCSSTETERFGFQIHKALVGIRDINLVLLVPHDALIDNLKAHDFKSFYGCSINHIYALTKIEGYDNLTLL